MEARLFIEVESIKEIEYCYQSLSNEYKFIFVFCISDHQDVFHYCMQHRLPICPSTHVLSDQQLVKRYKHNIFFNLCEEYIPHIMLSYTIVKVDNIEEIIYLSKRSFHSYLWLGSDDDIPRIQKRFDLPLIRTINSSSDKIGLYGIDSYWLKSDNVTLFT